MEINQEPKAYRTEKEYHDDIRTAFADGYGIELSMPEVRDIGMRTDAMLNRLLGLDN